MGRIVRISAEELRNKPKTPEQLARLKRLAESEPTPDEELPEMTDEQLQEFKTLAELREAARRAENNKKVVTLRLSPQTYNKAQSLGKGYTSILSRIIETALNDPEILKRCV